MLKKNISIHLYIYRYICTLFCEVVYALLAVQLKKKKKAGKTDHANKNCRTGFLVQQRFR